MGWPPRRLPTGSPYLQENLIRAKAESTLVFFLFGGALLRDLSLRRAGPNWPSARWGILTGLFLGLAFGTKLTTILAMVAVGLWGVMAVLDSRFGPWTRLLPAWMRLPLSRAQGEGCRRSRYSRRAAAGGEGTSPVALQHPRGAPWVWPLAVLVTTMVVFIGTNPFTWGDPVGRSWLLFENRRV